MIILDNKDKE